MKTLVVDKPKSEPSLSISTASSVKFPLQNVNKLNNEIPNQLWVIATRQDQNKRFKRGIKQHD